MSKVVALGELLIDFVTVDKDSSGYPTIKASPGGAPANFLAALSAYGVDAALIGSVGNDAFGRMLKKTLDDRNIDTTCLALLDDYFTTLAFVTLDSTGNREFSFARKPGADTQISLNEISKAAIKSADVFHFGTLSLTDDHARKVTEEAVNIAHNSGVLVSCDPNYRAPLWPSEETAKKAMEWALSQADVIKMSDEEAMFLWGENEVDAANRLLSGRCELCFITLGPKGCYYASKNHKGYVVGPVVNPVDTTGAGDIFGGSVMSQLLKIGKEISKMTDEDIRQAVNFAVTAASLSTEYYGGISSVVDEADVISAIRQVI